MDNVTTATGLCLKSNACNYSPAGKTLYVTLENTTMEAAAKIFENPAETAKLSTSGETFEGFTHVAAIINENGRIRVNLEKENG